MLVLTRRKDESIVIDGDIEITVVAIFGNSVRLGITAPKNLQIIRKEIEKKYKKSTKTPLMGGK